MASASSVSSIEQSAGSIAERAFDPARFLAAASRASDESLVELYHQTRRVGGVIWMSASICCGIAYERAEAKGGEIGVNSLAKTFETNKSEISRMARTYRLIIVPRCKEQGDAAVFPIRQRRYYELACDAAVYSNKAATELLAIAEDALAQGRFTAREYKSILIHQGLLPETETGTVTAAVPKILQHLKGLQHTKPDIREATVAKMMRGNTREWLVVVLAAASTIAQIEHELTIAIEEEEAAAAEVEDESTSAAAHA